MIFPICSPHHLSLDDVLIKTTSQPKVTHELLSENRYYQSWRNIYILLH